MLHRKLLQNETPTLRHFIINPACGPTISWIENYEFATFNIPQRRRERCLCMDYTQQPTVMDIQCEGMSLNIKHFAKKCKNKTCRDALPPKNTFPKTNETSDSAHRNACTDYPHIYRVATIPTSFQPHPPQLCTTWDVNSGGLICCVCCVWVSMLEGI